jgi:L-ascorbate metabolism protein UlaG (beta-lactamase superfamily)
LAKLTWFGHAAFKVELAGSTILVDPFLDRNPVSPVKSSDIVKADAVFVTHDHGDHLGDAFAICKNTKATFVATVELGDYAEQNGVVNVAGLNIGGSVNVKKARLTVVQAIHTSSKGTPTGVVIEGNGKSVYHAGDTGLFGDMRLIGELYRPDVALLPIGGYYTMGAREAAEAVKMLGSKVVVPMHYKTFDVLAKSAVEFVKYVKKKAPKTKVVVLKPGGHYKF